MNTMKSLCGALIAGAFVSTAIAGDAVETAFDKPLHIIAPAAPGGILDQTSRLVAKALSEVVKQPVIVDNAPGAGGTIGIQNLLRAKPDGYTLVMGSLGPNAANYTLRKSLPYKQEDLIPVIHVLSMPNVLVANPQLGAKTVADLKRLSKSLPKGLSMAVSTSGSSGHLTGELLKSSTGIQAVNIVYRGAAPALTDLMGGQVDIMVDNLITSLPQIRGGKLVPIAVTSPQRVPELPNVPTFVEAGYPDIEVAVWLGLFVSAETPPAMVSMLSEALQKVMASDEIRKQFAEAGGLAIGGSQASFKAFVTAEKNRWEKVIQAAGITVD
ncbi:MAG: tripartite tricarboxylate transporter substrate binding protein [Burkholderiaceae bacterium]